QNNLKAMSYDLNITVGYYENSPKSFENNAGDSAGIFPELLNHIALQEDWNVTWIKNNWSECLNSLETGEIDIMIDVAYSETRNEKYDFNNIEVLTNWGVIYSREGLNIKNLEDLENQNVSVMVDSFHTIGDYGIINMTEREGINCSFTYYNNYEEVFESLNQGNTDVGVVNRIFGIYHEDDYNVEKTSIMFNPNKLLFAFPKNATKNQELISRIDYNLYNLKEDSDSIYHQILNKYLYQIGGFFLPEWFYPVLITVIALIIIFSLLSVSLIILAGKLKSNNKKLKRLNEMEKLFVASINHELKSPLTAIIGFTSILLEENAGTANQEQEKELNIVLRNANFLVDLINDLGYISKIDSDEKDIQISTFNLADLINELKESFLIETNKKQIELKIKLIQNSKIKNDKKKIKQILSNLISNAIKYTEKGKIFINLEDSGMEYIIRVKDTGIGIKEKDLKDIFKPFMRLQKQNQSIKGSGLGLYISKKLAIQLGGTINVESEFGNGTTFTLLVKKNIENLKN
ncbi:MAG: transporter substrate-binding domain-containing protein, partial [Promethearchaeota archaeon]